MFNNKMLEVNSDKKALALIEQVTECPPHAPARCPTKHAPRTAPNQPSTRPAPRPALRVPCAWTGPIPTKRPLCLLAGRRNAVWRADETPFGSKHPIPHPHTHTRLGALGQPPPPPLPLSSPCCVSITVQVKEKLGAMPLAVLLKGMLQVDPMERVTAKQALAMLPGLAKVALPTTGPIIDMAKVAQASHAPQG